MVARTQVPVLELPCVAERGEGLIEEFRAGAWVVGVFEDPEHGDDAEALLAELLAVTGWPALVAGVYDSDAVAVTASSSGHGVWRAALAHAAMRGLCEDEDEDFDELYPPPSLAAVRSAAWARDAQLEPDGSSLLATLEVPDGDPFAEPLFFRLLTGLGIPIDDKT